MDRNRDGRRREIAIDAQELVTGRTCIIAQSGAGKIGGLQSSVSKLCWPGWVSVSSIRRGYPRSRICFPSSGSGPEMDVMWILSGRNLRELMREAICSRTAVIFDVSETDMQGKVAHLANILYDLESELRQPCLLIVEEADKFIPQSGESLKKIEEISRRGRKRGLGLLVATQRPSPL